MSDPKCECGHQASSHRIISGNCIGVDGGRYIVNPPGCECESSCEEVRAESYRREGKE